MGFKNFANRRSRTLCAVVTVVVSLLNHVAVAEQTPLAVAYYDVESLYDTIPSPHYNDRAYTPEGESRWTAERYEARVRRVASVVDSLGLPIVVLMGVESEAVVRDVVEQINGDYSYIHRTLDYYDGLDFALLYYGDRLFVERVDSGRTWLSVASETLDGQSVDILLTRRGGAMRGVSSPIEGREADFTIVAGDLSRRDLSRLNLYDPFEQMERKGYGDTRSSRGWYFDSRIGTKTRGEAVVYIRDWLLDSSGAPLSAPRNGSGADGYSSHLPIILYFCGE